MPKFEQLIEPVSIADFFREYLDRKPLHLTGRPAAIYSDLFSWIDMESIAQRTARNLSSKYLRVFRMVRDAAGASRQDELAVPDADAFDLSDWMRSKYREGYTFHFRRLLHSHSTALAHLVQDLRLLFNCEVKANAFLSPPHARGLPGHFDAEDALMLQIHGEKRWHLYRGAWPNLPLESDGAPPPGPDASQVVTRAGDLLYLPRGTAHEPSTGDAASLHLTLGIYPYRWMDLIDDLCERAAEGEIALRERVPFGPGGVPPQAAALRKTLSLALKSFKPQTLMDTVLKAHRRRLLEASTVEGGIFVPAPAADTITGSTSVCLAGDCVVSTNPEQTLITVAGSTLAVPLVAHEALQWIARTRASFTVSALPDSLDEVSKRILVSRLLREGILQLVECT